MPEKKSLKDVFLAVPRILMSEKVAVEVKRAFIVQTSIFFLFNFSFFGLSTWIPVIFQRLNLNNVYGSSFLFAFGAIPGNITTYFTDGKIRRKKRAIFGASVAFTCILICALLTSNDAAVVVFSLLFNVFITIAWNALNCLSPESYPSKYRSTLMGMTSAISRLGSVIAQFVNGSLEKQVMVLLLVTSGAMLLGTMLTMVLVEHRADDHQDDDDDEEEEEVMKGEVASIVDEDTEEELMPVPALA